jgi:type II secretory pathway predicted ATPase ExeA
MFQAFYGFTRPPFSKDLPTEHLFVTADHQELAARLTVLLREQGMGVVTGEIGAGKSTALRHFVAGLDANRYCVIPLANPTLGLTGLLRDLLIALRYEPPFSRPKLVARLRAAFDELIQTKHRFPLILIDEAHLLPATAFEPLRLLLSAHLDSQALGSLLLIGHPELATTLRLSTHQAFNQRLGLRYHLAPLDLQLTLGYIQHHLTVAGYKGGPLFTDDALTRIFDFTKGVPRQINRVCVTALLAGMIDKKSVLEESTVRKAIADLEQH